MRNQPFNPLLPADDSSGGSLIDPPSALRFRLLACGFLCALAIVFVRVAYVQAQLQDDYLAALSSTTTEYEYIPAMDGRILTDNAVVLATDVEQYAVEVHYRWLQDPVDEAWLKRRLPSELPYSERREEGLFERFLENFRSDREQMWQQLADGSGISVAVLADRRRDIQTKVERISDSVNRRRQVREVPDDDEQGILMKFASAVRRTLTTPPRRSVSDRIVVREEETWHEVITSVSLDVVGRIRDQPQLFPGVRVVSGSRRTYPQAAIAPHVIGARTEVADDEFDDPTAGDFRPRVGRFGVEKTYNRDLQGRPGLRRIVRNRRLEVVESVVERNPVSGRDVVLTLNLPLQKHAERLLDEALTDRPGELLEINSDAGEATTPKQIPLGGAIVVMEVATGRIVVAASAPRFSLSLYTERRQADWDAARADSRPPFLNRVVQTAFVPGSVMKPVTAAAAVETNSINPDEPFYCQGFLQQPDQHRCLLFRMTGHGHDRIDLPRAIAQSCNVYFFTAAQKIGFSRLRQWHDRFGFGKPTGVDLPFETSGSLPGTATVNAETDKRFRYETLGLAIGQSRVTVTPLQLARSFAAIANGGWLVTPHVVSIDGTPRTTTDVDDRPREVTRRKITGLSAKSLDRIREGLTATVQQPYGTAFRTAHLEGIEIAGKTGTAQTTGGKPDHAWFAGYVPAEKPRFAFAIVLEHGGSGSRAAGPVAREIVLKTQSLGLLP